MDTVLPYCQRPKVSAWIPMSWRRPASPPVACGTHARRPAAEIWHFLLQGPRQSRKSGGLYWVRRSA